MKINQRGWKKEENKGMIFFFRDKGQQGRSDVDWPWRNSVSWLKWVWPGYQENFWPSWRWRNELRKTQWTRTSVEGSYIALTPDTREMATVEEENEREEEVVVARYKKSPRSFSSTQTNHQYTGTRHRRPHRYFFCYLITTNPVKPGAFFHHLTSAYSVKFYSFFESSFYNFILALEWTVFLH